MNIRAVAHCIERTYGVYFKTWQYNIASVCFAARRVHFNDSALPQDRTLECSIGLLMQPWLCYVSMVTDGDQMKARWLQRGHIHMAFLDTLVSYIWMCNRNRFLFLIYAYEVLSLIWYRYIAELPCLKDQMIPCRVSVFSTIYFILYISNSVAAKGANHYRGASWRCKVSYICRPYSLFFQSAALSTFGRSLLPEESEIWEHRRWFDPDWHGCREVLAVIIKKKSGIDRNTTLVGPWGRCKQSKKENCCLHC